MPPQFRSRTSIQWAPEFQRLVMSRNVLRLGGMDRISNHHSSQAPSLIPVIRSRPWDFVQLTIGLQVPKKNDKGTQSVSLEICLWFFLVRGCFVSVLQRRFQARFSFARASLCSPSAEAVDSHSMKKDGIRKLLQSFTLKCE